MSSKLSVEEVLSNLEDRAVFHREQEAFHARQWEHHQEQQTLHAAELEKVLKSLEAFRAVSESAVVLAKPVAPKPVPAPPVPQAKEPELPPPGRLMTSRLLRLAVESPELQEPFSATTVAAETNRRFASHLRSPIGSRTASDVLRRMLAEGQLQLARKGKAFHEAWYQRVRGGVG
jgi:hypothetical protein